MNTKQPGVYAITNKSNGNQYVGSAINIDQRWRSHKSALANHKKSPPKLQQAWDKYGSLNFEFSVLEFCPRDKTLICEQKWIDTLRPKYNTRSEASSNLGVIWSKETNRKKGRPTQTYTVNGVTGGITFLAKHFGIVTCEAARTRLARGYTIDRAVTEPPMTSVDIGKLSGKSRAEKGIGSRDGNFTAFGETMSLKKLVSKFSTNTYFVVRSRIRRGSPVEEALTKPPRVRK